MSGARRALVAATCVAVACVAASTAHAGDSAGMFALSLADFTTAKGETILIPRDKGMLRARDWVCVYVFVRPQYRAAYVIQCGHPSQSTAAVSAIVPCDGEPVIVPTTPAGFRVLCGVTL